VNVGERLNGMSARTDQRCPVLLVDDNAVSRALLTDHLTSAGYAVRDVDNAAHALDVLRERDARMVIVDWVMPHMTGLELCRRVGALPLARHERPVRPRGGRRGAAPRGRAAPPTGA
jgi:CheY-like chemotaxis protein